MGIEYGVRFKQPNHDGHETIYSVSIREDLLERHDVRGADVITYEAQQGEPAQFTELPFLRDERSKTRRRTLYRLDGPYTKTLEVNNRGDRLPFATYSYEDESGKRHVPELVLDAPGLEALVDLELNSPGTTIIERYRYAGNF
jgi:hypothetical protein